MPEPSLITRSEQSRSLKWGAAEPGEIAAWIAEMDFALADPVREALRRAVDDSDLGYPPLQDQPLADAVTGWYASHHGWTIDPDRVLLLPGVMRAVEQAIAWWTAPGEGVLVTTPIYPPFLDAVRDAGRRLVEAPMPPGPEGYQLDLDAVADGLRSGARLVLLSNPHNPTGRVFTAAELAALGALVVEHDAWLVADEIHAPLVFPGGIPHTPIASLDPAVAARTLTAGSASKGWNIPGAKSAFAVAGSEAMRSRWAALPPDAQFAASPLGVRATVAALTEGQPWLDGVLARLDANRRLLAALLAEHLPGVGYHLPEATFLAWLDCRALGLPGPLTVADQFRAGAKVWLSTGEDFGRPGTGHVRLNFATSPELLTEMVERIGTFVAAGLPG